MYDANFFVYQHRVLRPLLAWGVGSSVSGALLLLFGVSVAELWRDVAPVRRTAA